MKGTLIIRVQFSSCGWEKSSLLISIWARQRRLQQDTLPWLHAEIRGGIAQIYSRSFIWILSDGFSFDWKNKIKMHSPMVCKISKTAKMQSLDIFGGGATLWLTALRELSPSPWQDTLNRPHNSDVRPLTHRAATHQTKPSKPQRCTDQKNLQPTKQYANTDPCLI